MTKAKEKKKTHHHSHWIDVNDEKPSERTLVYVINKNHSCDGFVATYYPKEDVFVLCNMEIYYNIPLSVTHWVPLPNCFDDSQPYPGGEV